MERREAPDTNCCDAERSWSAAAPGAVRAGAERYPAGIQDLYRTAIDLSPLMPWIADRDGNLLEIDSRLAAAIGAPPDDCLGDGLRRRVHPDDEPIVDRQWSFAKGACRTFDIDARVRMNDAGYRWYRMRGAPRCNAGGEVLYWYGTIEDFHERKCASEAIRWAADHDELTGLYNRTALKRKLGRAFERASRCDGGLMLLIVDLGSLQPVNERYGHEFGDELLRQAAGRLSEGLFTGAFAARTGSAEFAVCLACPDDTVSESLLAPIRARLEAPFALDGHSHHVDASIGVALYPRDAASADALYRSADLALSEAKGGARIVRRFDAEMRARNQLRLSTLAVVREALDRGSVFPYYQPQIDLRNNAITGFEALLRWEHRQSGVQSAAAIASAFREPALAVALDRHMFTRVAADMRAWRAAGLAFGKVAINTAVVRFASGDVADELLNRIAAEALDPASFELEITEDVLIGRNPERLARDLDRLRAAGMAIALDDFGTGFASLIHLRQFNIDTLKIDRSFVQNMHDRTSGAVVSALIRLGKQLNIRTVAEGIETPAQRTELRRKGCDLGQGYLFSAAVPASAVPQLLGVPGADDTGGGSLRERAA